MSLYTEAVATIEQLRVDLAASQDRVKALEDADKVDAQLVCKGSMALGSGCGKCSRCKAEISAQPDPAMAGDWEKTLRILADDYREATTRVQRMDAFDQLRGYVLKRVQPASGDDAKCKHYWVAEGDGAGNQIGPAACCKCGIVMQERHP